MPPLQPLQLLHAHNVQKPRQRPPAHDRTASQGGCQPQGEASLRRQRHPVRPLYRRQRWMAILPPSGRQPHLRPPQGGTGTHLRPRPRSHAQALLCTLPRDKTPIHRDMPSGWAEVPAHPLLHQLSPRLQAAGHGGAGVGNEADGLPPRADTGLHTHTHDPQH